MLRFVVSQATGVRLLLDNKKSDQVVDKFDGALNLIVCVSYGYHAPQHSIFNVSCPYSVGCQKKNLLPSVDNFFVGSSVTLWRLFMLTFYCNHCFSAGNKTTRQW
jgi:hypothetical protein